MIGPAYEQFRKMVQLEIYALKATAGPKYSNPKSTLKSATARIAFTGTLNRPSIRDILKLCQYFATALSPHQAFEETYNFEHGAPSSLPIAHNRRLPDVTLPIVPLMKQTARAQLITTPAVRLSVAWMINSMSGLPVSVVSMASGLGIQNSRVMIIEIPL